MTIKLNKKISLFFVLFILTIVIFSQINLVKADIVSIATVNSMDSTINLLPLRYENPTDFSTVFETMNVTRKSVV